MRRILCYLLVVLGVVPVMADVFDEAQWLRDPRMAGFPTLNYLIRGHVPKLPDDAPKNIHTLLRKEITLRGAPTSAQLYITGDDYYVFSINGRPVVQGPEGGYDFSYPYYWLDVTQFLTAGPNSLASHSFYQGLRNRVWASADNRSGFILKLVVTYDDGTSEAFVTDETWRAHALMAFSGYDTMGYATQFYEHIDMRLMPVGWEHVGFDDQAWDAPLVERQDHVFLQQITPPLQRYRVEPKTKTQLDDGTWFYDFGTEIVGHTRVQVQGEAGHVLTVRHGEELLEDGRVRYKLRAGMTFDEHPILSGGNDRIAFYDYRAFRYMEVVNAPHEPEVWVEVRHHPFKPEASLLTSDDQAVADIFSICKNAVHMASQGGFLDCPTREKGQYLGDAVITSRAHLWLTGDDSLTRKALYDFYLSCQVTPGMLAVAPVHFLQEIAEFPLQYPLMLEAFYQHSGDKEFLAALVDKVFPGLFAYYAGFENDAGLIERVDKWLVVDWPGNMRYDYDYNYSKDKANTVLNGFYYGALKSAARLEQALGRDGAAYTEKAARVAEGFASQLANPETGLYVDAPGSTHSSVHANAIPLAFGLTAGADRDKMLALIKERGLECGVYIAAYVIEACFRAGDADLGYALLTNDSKNSWKEMLRAGTTTSMETWSPDQKSNMSWCHPWSSSPVYIIPEHVLGLSPGSPGWGSVRVAPPAIQNLPAMSLTVPHPKGPMTMTYAPGKGYHLTVPEGVVVDIQAEEGVVVTTNGKVSMADTNTQAPQATTESATAPIDLATYGWQEKVGDGLGVWIEVATQQFHLIEKGVVLKTLPCATASAGTGSESGSLQTPLGWHTVSEKFGAGAPWGQVFRSRQATKEIWKPGDDVKEDLVLTRVLWLDGLEAGINQGTRDDGVLVDSKTRCIYIHGTNGESVIGTPSSHGCIRLLNDDVVKIFEEVPLGTPVLITETKGQ